MSQSPRRSRYGAAASPARTTSPLSSPPSRLLRLVGDGRPERGQHGVGGLPDPRSGGRDDRRRDPGMHPVGHQPPVLAVARPATGPPRPRPARRRPAPRAAARRGRVTGSLQPPPQVRPGRLDDDRLPVAVLQAGQELRHQPRLRRQHRQRGRPSSRPGRPGTGPGPGRWRRPGRTPQVRCPSAACLRGRRAARPAGPGRPRPRRPAPAASGCPCTTRSTRRTRSRSRVRVRGGRRIATGPSSACSRPRRFGSSRASATASSSDSACTGSVTPPAPRPAGDDPAGQDQPGLAVVAGQRGDQRLPARVAPAPVRGEQGFQVVQHEQHAAVLHHPPQPRQERLAARPPSRCAPAMAKP